MKWILITAEISANKEGSASVFGDKSGVSSIKDKLAYQCVQSQRHSIYIEKHL